MIHDSDQRRFWGLQAAPFDETRNPRFFYASPLHQEALTRLIYATRQNHAVFTVLTSDVGCGKTMLAGVFAQQLDDRHHVVVSIRNPRPTYGELMAEILANLVDDQIEVDTVDPFMMDRAFRRVCEQTLVSQGRRLVLVLDEAQAYDDATFESLRRLTNLGDDTDRFPVTVILSGQVELYDQLRDLPLLDQRVDMRVHVEPFDEAELADLLTHRLMAAGHETGDIFDAACIAPLHAATHGVPRIVCRIARLAMDNAYASRNDRIDLDCVEEILADLRIQMGVATQV